MRLLSPQKVKKAIKPLIVAASTGTSLTPVPYHRFVDTSRSTLNDFGTASNGEYALNPQNTIFLLPNGHAIGFSLMNAMIVDPATLTAGASTTLTTANILTVIQSVADPYTFLALTSAGSVLKIVATQNKTLSASTLYADITPDISTASVRPTSGFNCARLIWNEQAGLLIVCSITNSDANTTMVFRFGIYSIGATSLIFKRSYVSTIDPSYTLSTAAGFGDAILQADGQYLYSAIVRRNASSTAALTYLASIRFSYNPTTNAAPTVLTDFLVVGSGSSAGVLVPFVTFVKCYDNYIVFHASNTNGGPGIRYLLADGSGFTGTRINGSGLPDFLTYMQPVLNGQGMWIATMSGYLGFVRGHENFRSTFIGGAGSGSISQILGAAVIPGTTTLVVGYQSSSDAYLRIAVLKAP